MNQNAEFAKQIQTARQRLGLSQSQAATKWAVSLKSLQNWEQGISHPTGATLLRLLPLIQARKKR